MAKSQTSQATKQAGDIYKNAPGAYQPITQGLQSQQQQTQQTQQQTGQQATSGFTNAQTTGGYDPTQLAGLRTTAQGFTQTGGYDPTQLANITSGYQSLATGGYTPEQEAAFINVGTSGVGSTYDVLAQQEQRKRAAQGLGMGGGEYAELAREGTAAQEDATLKAQTQLASIENANKVAGLGGLGATAADVAAKKQAGFGQQAGIESGVAGGSLAASKGLSDLFNTETGQLTTQGNQILQSVNSMFGVQMDATQLMAALSKNPGLFGNILNAVSSVFGGGSGGSGG